MRLPVKRPSCANPKFLLGKRVVAGHKVPSSQILFIEVRIEHFAVQPAIKLRDRWRRLFRQTGVDDRSSLGFIDFRIDPKIEQGPFDAGASRVRSITRVDRLTPSDDSPRVPFRLAVPCRERRPGRWSTPGPSPIFR